MRHLALVAIAACGSGGSTGEPPTQAAEPGLVRVAVIGGMMDTGFWPEVVARFETATKHRVQVVATGNKPIVIDAFRKGGIDLITVHASDAMVNLVADGLAVDPQPWARNDLVIVGPVEDPAGIRGLKSAGEALGKLRDAKAKLLVHATMGADTVLHDLQEIEKVKLDAETLQMFTGADQHQILAEAKRLGAYTIVGRIPFVNGKLREAGIVLMVQGDPLLRRPYLVELSPKAPQAARDLHAFLRSKDTQAWIATFGVGKYDAEPLFYPVVIP